LNKSKIINKNDLIKVQHQKELSNKDLYFLNEDKFENENGDDNN